MNNASEVDFATDDSVGVENSSQVLLPPFPPGPPALPLASLVVGLVTGVTGTCANAVVLAVLLVARRRYYGSGVNMFIANQSAMDLAACIFLVVAFGLSFPGAPPNYLALGEVVNNAVCFLLRSRVLAIVCMNAGKIGPLLPAAAKHSRSLV